MNPCFIHSDPLGDPLRAGIDLGVGDDETAVSLYSGELGFIECVRFVWSPPLLHCPPRRGRRARPGSARSRKRAMHAAGMRSGRVFVRRKILPPWVSVDEILERAGRDVERDDLARPSPLGADALAYMLGVARRPGGRALAGNPFRNIAAETSGAAHPPEFRRAGGGCVCVTCGREYRSHPHSEHRDWNDDPFLNRLCNGDLVKL